MNYRGIYQKVNPLINLPMKKIILLLIPFLILSLGCYSQNRNLEIMFIASVDNKKIINKANLSLDKKPGNRAMVQEVLNSIENLYFKLYTTDRESIFIIDESLKRDKKTYINLVEVLAGSQEVYTNYETQEILEKPRHFPNTLVKPSSNNWTLINEKKVIKNKKCYKAIGTRIETNSSGENLNVTCTAWYTPEISIPFGPSIYSGLPGLILRLETSQGLIFDVEHIKEFNTQPTFVRRPEGKIINKGEYSKLIKSTRNKIGSGF